MPRKYIGKPWKSRHNSRWKRKYPEVSNVGSYVIPEFFLPGYGLTDTATRSDGPNTQVFENASPTLESEFEFEQLLVEYPHVEDEDDAGDFDTDDFDGGDFDAGDFDAANTYQREAEEPRPLEDVCLDVSALKKVKVLLASEFLAVKARHNTSLEASTSFSDDEKNSENQSMKSASEDELGYVWKNAAGVDDHEGIHLKDVCQKLDLLMRRFSVIEKKTEANMSYLLDVKKQLNKMELTLCRIEGASETSSAVIMSKLPLNTNEEVADFLSNDGNLTVVATHLKQRHEPSKLFVYHCCRTVFTDNYRMTHLFRTGTRDESKSSAAGKALVPPKLCNWLYAIVTEYTKHLSDFSVKYVRQSLCNVFTKVKAKKLASIAQAQKKLASIAQAQKKLTSIAQAQKKQQANEAN